jgi:hypothetical protein
MILDRGEAWLLYPMWLAGGSVSVAYFVASFNFLLKLVSASAKLTAYRLVSSLTHRILHAPSPAPRPSRTATLHPPTPSLAPSQASAESSPPKGQLLHVGCA